MKIPNFLGFLLMIHAGISIIRYRKYLTLEGRIDEF